VWCENKSQEKMLEKAPPTKKKHGTGRFSIAAQTLSNYIAEPMRRRRRT
jgi:hypothetical protein